MSGFAWAGGRAELRLQPALTDVVFAHVPKTAGTSLRNSLVEAFPGRTKVYDYGPNTVKFGGAFADQERSEEGIRALRQMIPSGDKLLVCGHLKVVKYLSVFHPASFVTFLRHPVERVISSYKHHVAYRDYRGSLAEFAEQPGEINNQCAHLWGIDLRNIGFIGLTERMPEMLAALSRHLGVELKMRRDNVSPDLPGVTVDESTRAHIMALNQRDMQLYRHVEANLEDYTNYRRRGGNTPVLAQGAVRRHGKGVFQGWAAPFHGGRLIEIEVRAGEQVVHRCYADQFRPVLKKKGLEVHGVGGFSVQLPKAMLKEQVRFVIAGTDKDLDGSPIAL